MSNTLTVFFWFLKQTASSAEFPSKHLSCQLHATLSFPRLAQLLLQILTLKWNVQHFTVLVPN